MQACSRAPIEEAPAFAKPRVVSPVAVKINKTNENVSKSVLPVPEIEEFRGPKKKTRKVTMLTTKTDFVCEYRSGALSQEKEGENQVPPKETTATTEKSATRKIPPIVIDATCLVSTRPLELMRTSVNWICTD